MRKTNRLWAICLAVVLMFCMSVSLTACSKSGTIPDGKYEQIDYFSQTYIYGKNLKNEAYWKIEKNRAEFWDSGGEYLKVSIGKGLITYEDLAELIARYSEFFE